MQVTYEGLREFIINQLKNKPDVTEKDIQDAVASMIKIVDDPNEINQDTLIKDLTHVLYLYKEYRDPDIFDGVNPDHEMWLERSKEDIDWLYWGRYQKYLLKSGMSPYAVTNIDTVTNDILSRLENPERPGNWDRRGMVVGYVQSGKTANYVGLICKAADAGYRLIIVLAGMHNNLRSQTQKRIDDGFIGSKKETTRKVITGVGLVSRDDMINKRPIPKDVNSLTNSGDNGDFRREKAKITMSAQIPVCLVVKKQHSVLENVYDWALDLAANSGIPGKVTNVPLLIIDDESDNASPNTKKYQSSETQNADEITSINKLIRRILNTFQKSAYVGYTATPYANVFIDPKAVSDDVGSDLFPRDFIISMKEPPGYFGSDCVFNQQNSGDIKNSLFPGIVLIPDKDPDILIPEDKRSDSTYVPKNLPPSLKEAIKSFLLTCAVREIRSIGGKKRIDNSMLIHVTRYTAAQGGVIKGDETQEGLFKLVNAEIEELKANMGIGDPDTEALFRDLWDSKFDTASKKIRGIINDTLCTEVEWADVYTKVNDLVWSSPAKLKIKVINGKATDSLDYSGYPNGLNVIAIGGDKLSRGLTLEGLSTSYFLRTARTYDTLLQMGRWFGFRHGYEDLCRIYTTPDIIYKFQVINEADAHLRDQFMLMDAESMTPENYGLKIKQNDSRFRITQQNKMRTGEKQLGNPYSGSLHQTYKFQTTPDIIKDNFQVIDQFLMELCKSAPPKYTDENNYMWKDVSPDTLLKHMKHYKNHPNQPQIGEPLYQYIREQALLNKELTNWTVILINNSSKGAIKKSVGGITVGLSIRNPDTDSHPEITGEFSYSKNQIINNASEEGLDLTEEDKKRIDTRMMADYQYGKRTTDGKKIRNDAKPPEKGKPTGPYIRLERSVTQGLLLIYPITWEKRVPKDGTPVIGLAYSFPVSNTALTEEYVVNRIGQMELSDYE